MKRLIKQSLWTEGPNIDKLNEGPKNKNWYDPNAITCIESGKLSIDTVLQYPGHNGEVRQWETWKSPKGIIYELFGNYEKSEWEEFLEDIKTNGIKDPITINVEADGSTTVWEGNHRIQAAVQLGMLDVPVKVYYRGNSQREHRIT